VLSDTVDELTSEEDSFHEDDLYGMDHAMEAISDSSDEWEDSDNSNLTDEQMVQICSYYYHIYSYKLFAAQIHF
jgi:hypothetical protein